MFFSRRNSAWDNTITKGKLDVNAAWYSRWLRSNYILFAILFDCYTQTFQESFFNKIQSLDWKIMCIINYIISTLLFNIRKVHFSNRNDPFHFEIYNQWTIMSLTDVATLFFYRCTKATQNDWYQYHNDNTRDIWTNNGKERTVSQPEIMKTSAISIVTEGREPGALRLQNECDSHYARTFFHLFSRTPGGGGEN